MKLFEFPNYMQHTQHQKRPLHTEHCHCCAETGSVTTRTQHICVGSCLWIETRTWCWLLRGGRASRCCLVTACLEAACKDTMRCLMSCVALCTGWHLVLLLLLLLALGTAAAAAVGTRYCCCCWHSDCCCCCWHSVLLLLLLLALRHDWVCGVATESSTAANGA